MRLKPSHWALALVLPALLLVMGTPLAFAADPVPTTLELKAPRELSFGETTTITTILRDGKGTPIPNATVVLWTPADFLGTGGAMVLGKAVTDGRGRAEFLYEARAGGKISLQAYFQGDGRYAPAVAGVELTVTGSGQLYSQTVEVAVPGLAWILAGLLGSIWGCYLYVMVNLTRIARVGSDIPLATRKVNE